MMIAVSLQYKNRLYYHEMQNGETWSLGSHKKDSQQIAEMSAHQIRLSTSGEKISVKTEAPFCFKQTDVQPDSIITIDRESNTFLYYTHATNAIATQPLPYDGLIRIGRSEKNDITIGLPFVSSKHLSLRIHEGNVRAEDSGSTNGLFLNGMRINAAAMQSGDVLNIFTLQIRLINGQLEFQNAGRYLNTHSFAPKNEAVRSDFRNRSDLYIQYRRSPRVQEELPHECIILDNPPAEGRNIPATTLSCFQWQAMRQAAF